MSSEIVVYEHPVSPYAQTVKIALREKGIKFDLRRPEVPGAATPDTFKSANPRLEVPAFIHDNVTLFETPVILQYIEDKWPATPMVPTDPVVKAQSALAAHVAMTQYEALMWALGEIRLFGRATGELAAKLESNIQKIATKLQTWFHQKLGSQKYFGNDEFTYADACIVPIIDSSMRSGLGPAHDSALGDWLVRCKQRPSVQTTLQEAKAGQAGMSAMGKVLKQPQQRGSFKREYRDHRLDLMIRIGGISVVTEGLKNDNIRFSWPDVPREKL